MTPTYEIDLIANGVREQAKVGLTGPLELLVYRREPDGRSTELARLIVQPTLRGDAHLTLESDTIDPATLAPLRCHYFR